jgi:hypothetical protein
MPITNRILGGTTETTPFMQVGPVVNFVGLVLGKLEGPMPPPHTQVRGNTMVIW